MPPEQPYRQERPQERKNNNYQENDFVKSIRRQDIHECASFTAGHACRTSSSPPKMSASAAKNTNHTSSANGDLNRSRCNSEIKTTSIPRLISITDVARTPSQRHSPMHCPVTTASARKNAPYSWASGSVSPQGHSCTATPGSRSISDPNAPNITVCTIQSEESVLFARGASDSVTRMRQRPK